MAAKEASTSNDAQADDGSSIKVLVLYTPAVETAVNGANSVASLIATAISETNAGYSTSGVSTSLSLVGTAKVSYSEHGTDVFSTALNDVTGTSDGNMDEIHALRDSLQADLVVLLIDNGQYCGMAWLPSTVSSSNSSMGFSVTAWNCATGYYSFGHEIGHNMGARHDAYVDSGTSPYTYGKGYVNLTARIRSIMAYNNQCSDSGFNCTRVNHWSANGRLYNGNTAIGSASSQNNVALNNSKVAVSSYRTSPSTYVLNVSSGTNPPKLSHVTPCKPDSDAVLSDFSVVAACDRAPADANFHPAG